MTHFTEEEKLMNGRESMCQTIQLRRIMEAPRLKNFPESRDPQTALHGIRHAARQGRTGQTVKCLVGLAGAQPSHHCHLDSKRVAGLWHRELWAKGWRPGVLGLLPEPQSPHLLKETPVALGSLPCCSGDQGLSGQSQGSASKKKEIWHHRVRAHRCTQANTAGFM